MSGTVYIMETKMRGHFQSAPLLFVPSITYRSSSESERNNPVSYFIFRILKIKLQKTNKIKYFTKFYASFRVNFNIVFSALFCYYIHTENELP